MRAPPRRVLVACNDCGVEWMKIASQVAGWAGRCRSCAQKLLHGSDQYKAKQRELSRQQVLRQGGIPNAKKMDGSRCLDQHPRWKGGKWRPDQRERSFGEYAALKERTRERDGHKCTRCGSESKPLHMHHLKDWKTHPELRFVDDNVVTLCGKCHKEAHSRDRA